MHAVSRWRRRRASACSRGATATTPGIVARLVADGEQVYGVRVLATTLEDVYLEAVESRAERGPALLGAGQERRARVVVVAGYALRESLRRKVFLIVLLLSAAFLALYGVGVWRAFEDTPGSCRPTSWGSIRPWSPARPCWGWRCSRRSSSAPCSRSSSRSGSCAATPSADCSSRSSCARSGAARSCSRASLAAAGVCALYVAVLFAIETVTTGLIGGWWPDNVVAAGAELAFAVVIVVALSLLGSIFLTATANGIAVFMVFGGGLVAGLLAQIGRAIGSDTLRSIGRWASYVLPFEALYQDALHVITSGTTGFERFALELGPSAAQPAAGSASCSGRPPISCSSVLAAWPRSRGATCPKDRPL